VISITSNIEGLSKVCEAIKQKLKEGGVLILQGDLAAGKTTLTQAFAKYLGLDDMVTSPTFSLQQCYGESLYHYDIYNHGLDHFLALGMLEELEKEGYHFIEWGDDALAKLLTTAQIPTVILSITKEGNQERTYRIKDA